MRFAIEPLTAIAFVAIIGSPAAPLAADFAIQDLLQDCRGYNGPSGKSFCLGYMMGAAGPLSRMHSLQTDTIVKDGVDIFVSACTEGATTAALMQAFINWAEKHPQYWKYSAGSGATLALQATWPCR
jgi:hypothetical protein